MLIAFVCAVRYFNHFAEFVRNILENQWPYNIAGALGILLTFILSPITSVLSSHIIASTTGFHPSYFTSSFVVLSASFYVVLIITIIATASGFIALASGFSDNVSRRVFPVTFALAVPGLLIIGISLGRDEDLISRFEGLIIALDFDENARFERGFYAGADGKGRYYGTKVCGELPFEALIAPDPQGGYIVATPRAQPAKLQVPVHGLSDRVLATKYIYSFVPQDKCPTINAYTEQER
jgi:hypothetical protein